jgi:putative ABC transport system permease protein
VLLAALGATPRFLGSEARAMVVLGVLGGVVIGATIAYLLVKVLTGIFDPVPAQAWTDASGSATKGTRHRC